MKKIILLIFFLVLITNIQAQEIEGTSKNYSFNISKDPPKPPYLTIVESSLQFIDKDGNKMIDANESTRIIFQLQNAGPGDGLDLKAIVNEINNVNGLEFANKQSIGTLKTGNTRTVEIPISGKMNLINSKANFYIAIEELNGFGTDPFYYEINTRSFINPVVKIADYNVTSEGSTTLVKKKPFEVQVLVQNIGQGYAENVNINLTIPQNMFCLSGNESENIGNLAPGATKLITYSLIANNDYSDKSIPLIYSIKERYDKYGEDKTIKLTLDQPVSAGKIVVQGIQEQEQIEITEATLTSEVDKNIPYNPTKNPNRFALIIGNEDYQSYQTGLSSEMNVEFARNDASIFREYALRTLGVEEENLYFLTDATAGTMQQNIELVSKIISKIGKDAELIFYYSGHGFPDENTKIPYLMPVDVSATNLYSAIKLSEVYKKFSKTGAKRITIFLDACFSGGGRESGLLAARGVKIKPKEELLRGNLVVFSASSGEQSALPYKKQKHGMFTYFLLKKLQETKANITYGELDKYIYQKVSIESLRVNQKEQDPKVNVSSDVKDTWEMWKIR